MVYQTSFSKEVVVWEEHFAISLGKIHNSNVIDDKNNDNNVFSQLINTKVDKSSIRSSAKNLGICASRAFLRSYEITDFKPGERKGTVIHL